MIGVTGYGAYIPRLRMKRAAIVSANAWFAPNLVKNAQGHLALANWDEDSITMAVAAARDCLGSTDDRAQIDGLFLASTTLPFAERMNAAIVVEALTLEERVDAMEFGATQRAGLSAVRQALTSVRADSATTLVVATDQRRARPASSSELAIGDGAAALRIGNQGVIAEHLASATITTDFVDRFRRAGEPFDYNWEERWVREAGVLPIISQVIVTALERAGLDALQVDHFVCPVVGLDGQIARACGIEKDAVIDLLSDKIGHIGTGHAMLILSHLLSTCEANKVIVVAQFGSGGEALVFRTTAAIREYRASRGVAGWLARGTEEPNYTKFLSYKAVLNLDGGMRSEQDRKTALSTAYRHRKAILGLIGGRCEVTGQVHYPPSRLSYDQNGPLQDTQRPYKLAERLGTVLSWSAEYLSFHRAPPHTYGQVDFDGGGRILMEFTDVSVGDIAAGVKVEMTFRIKDVDDRRGYQRYFWKATPTQPGPVE